MMWAIWYTFQNKVRRLRWRLRHWRPWYHHLIFTVGKNDCDFPSIGAALNSLTPMRIDNKTRVILYIQSGTYDEVIRI